MTDTTTSPPETQPDDGKTRSGRPSLPLLPLGIVGAVVVALLLVYTVGGKDSGLVTQSIVTGLLLGGVYALVSVGLTLIFGVLGIVNFAQGAMLTLAMYLVYQMVDAGGIPVYVATLLAIPVMFLFGVLVQAALLNKLTMADNEEGPLLVTLGLSLLIVNVLLMIFGGRPKRVPSSVEGSFEVLDAIVSWERLIAFAGALLVAGALTLILRGTSFGLSIRAVSANTQGASLVGIDVRRIYAMTFGIGSACVAVAGGLMVPFLSLTPTVGEQFTILAFVIVVLGGLGSVKGAVVGGLVIGLVQTVGALYLPGTGSLILVFAVFVLVLFFRPQGIFGVKQ
ncbi:MULTISPECIES: branched-chain amino acid ABC transporter permease [Nocardioides]|uniref:Branched-chain amino acid ABC transporter permease n=1 Tax=Nocardioides oceani TaxID=3058369 RepID=A0ABT8FGS7_9ACTN|nr:MULTISPECIES: branched-chain amino acid ABC transporter permease [Nocardioides]MDN4173352.1 branched-chain amino acid ABC transporter permease [Nocardioides oceani]WKN48306.1 branched-chain amino acid ABC transporter permease [Nocardioides sp. Arc9.136]